MRWQDILWQECKKAYSRGEKVEIVFIRRDDKVLPIVTRTEEKKTLCDEEVIVRED